MNPTPITRPAAETTASESWAVESVRATLFTPQQLSDAFAHTSGAQPERQLRDPRTGMVEEAGPINSAAWLSARQLPGRLDLNILPTPVERLELGVQVSPPAEAGGDPLPSIGRFDTSIAALNGLLNRVSSHTTVLTPQRVAFGAVLFFPVPTLQTGYQALLAKMRRGFSLEGASDFFYQINRPRMVPLNGESVLINRLSKWSVMKLSAMNVVFNGSGFPTAAPVFEQHACRLELDMSTDAGRAQPLPLAIPALFDILERLGAEIVEQGDTP